MLTKTIFGERLAFLRSNKGVSAREMSLDLGQNPGYINGIENGKTFPSMENFLIICEYLGVTEKSFFDIDSSDSPEVQRLIKYACALNSTQLEHVTNIAADIVDASAKVTCNRS